MNSQSLCNLVLSSPSPLLKDVGQEMSILLHLPNPIQMASSVTRKEWVFVKSNSIPNFLDTENVEDLKFDGSEDILKVCLDDECQY